MPPNPQNITPFDYPFIMIFRLPLRPAASPTAPTSRPTRLSAAPTPPALASSAPLPAWPSSTPWSSSSATSTSSSSSFSRYQAPLSSVCSSSSSPSLPSFVPSAATPAPIGATRSLFGLSPLIYSTRMELCAVPKHKRSAAKNRVRRLTQVCARGAFFFFFFLSVCALIFFVCCNLIAQVAKNISHIARCGDCGELKLMHRLCLHCGGRSVRPMNAPPPALAPSSL